MLLPRPSTTGSSRASMAVDRCSTNDDDDDDEMVIKALRAKVLITVMAVMKSGSGGPGDGGPD